MKRTRRAIYIVTATVFAAMASMAYATYFGSDVPSCPNCTSSSPIISTGVVGTISWNKLAGDTGPDCTNGLHPTYNMKSTMRNCNGVGQWACQFERTGCAEYYANHPICPNCTSIGD